MRTAYQDKSIVQDEEGKVVGLNLGYDFCSEHEWGIKGIREAFGVGKAAKVGINARKITICPDDLVYIEEKEYAFLIYCTKSWMTVERKKEYNDDVVKRMKSCFSSKFRSGGDGKDIESEWCENNFAVGMKGEQKSILLDLYTAFQALNIAVSLTPATFMGRGLSFTIRDLLNNKLISSVLEMDMKHGRLQVADNSTGIKKRLEKAGLQYFALSPRWYDNNDEMKGIHYWLNPMKQDIYDACWCTVSDLDDWIKGKGKIVK